MSKYVIYSLILSYFHFFFIFCLVIRWQCGDRKCGRQRRGVRKLFRQLLMVAQTTQHSTRSLHYRYSTPQHDTAQLLCIALHCTELHCKSKHNWRSLHKYYSVLSSVCVRTLSNTFRCYYTVISFFTCQSYVICTSFLLSFYVHTFKT